MRLVLNIGKQLKRWGATYQLVPPNVHRRNITERAIRTFKAKYMWDNLLAQTELTINFLRQATLNQRMSAWEYYNGAFDYSATPLGLLVCKFIIHNTSNTRKSWYQRGRE